MQRYGFSCALRKVFGRASFVVCAGRLTPGLPHSSVQSVRSTLTGGQEKAVHTYGHRLRGAVVLLLGLSGSYFIMFSSPVILHRGLSFSASRGRVPYASRSASFYAGTVVWVGRGIVFGSRQVAVRFAASVAFGGFHCSLWHGVGVHVARLGSHI